MISGARRTRFPQKNRAIGSIHGETSIYAIFAKIHAFLQ